MSKVDKLTEEELHIVWDLAKESLGLLGNGSDNIDSEWLISMVEEIRVSRATKSVGMRLMELDGEARADLVGMVSIAMNEQDADEFVECLATISEMIFPELIGELKE